ncbi:pre-mRNA-splicing factor CWC22 homolog [Mesocricetus auratus]|uniref:Pre-mRNA-splicing factor CWC22 homolog n=1 Tax=Mesocricetus auratus TaxID=10036 RepID=A0ABM2XKN5_MESAU|nr:pre-mRNA-splicing factor CWC22 homolog [Mesocricetus auratus]
MESAKQREKRNSFSVEDLRRNLPCPEQHNSMEADKAAVSEKQQVCMLKKEYMEAFENIFREHYDTIHHLETNKLSNVAKMFAQLLYTDSLLWSVLECIKLSEDTTTSPSRIFIKIFFQALCEYMSLAKLNARLKDRTLQPFFEGLLPQDNPWNTCFAINFFTSM